MLALIASPMTHLKIADGVWAATAHWDLVVD
jgi:hypothetical protein